MSSDSMHRSTVNSHRAKALPDVVSEVNHLGCMHVYTVRPQAKYLACS